MPTEVEISKIENGYIVEYDRINPLTDMEEEVEVYFPTKEEAINFASGLLA